MTRREQILAVSIALFAAALAVASILSGDASKRMTREAVSAANAYAHFQAKVMRRTLYLLSVDGLTMTLAAGDDFLIRTRRDGYAREADRYAAEGRVILAAARAHEDARDDAIRRDGYFDLAQALLAVAIALATAALALPGRWLFVPPWVLALTGSALMIFGAA
ncbi:MAG: DUF4337 family protein [Hyphomicrobiales bacterium]|nr:DUF4337 family protein [Hyphomicrobiales bacterium]